MLYKKLSFLVILACAIQLNSQESGKIKVYILTGQFVEPTISIHDKIKEIKEKISRLKFIGEDRTQQFHEESQRLFYFPYTKARIYLNDDNKRLKDYGISEIKEADSIALVQK